MKIAVSALEAGLSAPVDPQFGRAKWLVIYDTETQSVESIDNSANMSLTQGAGIKTAELVSKHNCQVVLTGHLGPKALKTLQAVGIEGYNGITGTVRDAINSWKEGKLPKA
ncbi:MAG: dinitrogenase iron-molybdenum cofactor biosynthesis protein [Clostridia bacterium]|jgi:predicted Fe-Mo cluster-binding NifX family protein|nr:dinitrogenase iron-molybdenum cofactor biosynthesis protein [Clostridia bacterium]